MMQGIGVDVIRLSRMKETLERSGELFMARVFTGLESKQAKKAERPLEYLASAFAAKEAVFKALGLDWDRGADLKEIEVSRSPSGQPLVRLKGLLARNARAKGCKTVLLSISYETDLAIAIAMALDS